MKSGRSPDTAIALVAGGELVEVHVVSPPSVAGLARKLTHGAESKMKDPARLYGSASAGRRAGIGERDHPGGHPRRRASRSSW